MDTHHPLPQKHIDFYTKLLGMQLLRQRDIPEDKYSNAFLGYGGEDTNFAGEGVCRCAVSAAPSCVRGQGTHLLHACLPDPVCWRHTCTQRHTPNTQPRRTASQSS